MTGEVCTCGHGIEEHSAGTRACLAKRDKHGSAGQPISLGWADNCRAYRPDAPSATTGQDEPSAEVQQDERGQAKLCPRCGEKCHYDGWDHVHRSGLGVGSCGEDEPPAEVQEPLDPEDRDWVTTFVGAPPGVSVVHVFGEPPTEAQQDDERERVMNALLHAVGEEMPMGTVWNLDRVTDRLMAALPELAARPSADTETLLREALHALHVVSQWNAIAATLHNSIGVREYAQQEADRLRAALDGTA